MIIVIISSSSSSSSSSSRTIVFISCCIIITVITTTFTIVIVIINGKHTIDTITTTMEPLACRRGIWSGSRGDVSRACRDNVPW